MDIPHPLERPDGPTQAPLHLDDVARLEALHQYSILGTAPEQEFDDITHLAAQICGTPVSAITLTDHEHQWFKSIIGFEGCETPCDVSFCAHTILGNDLLIVSDITKDERFADNPFVTAEPHLRFYAGMPIINPEGHAVGTLCVFDTIPRQLDQSQQDALRRLARQAVVLLEARPDTTLDSPSPDSAIPDSTTLEATGVKGQSRQARLQARRQRRALTAETAQRDADELKASEVRYRRLFEAAQDGILILDEATGRIEDINPYLCQLLGYAAEELVGKQLWDIGAFRDIAANHDAFRTLQEKEYVRYDDLPLETKGGQSVSVEFVSNVYVSGDKKVIQCNIRDISGRKLAEASSARLAAIVESSEDAIISKTLDGIITTWNAGAQQLYGYTAQEAIGRPISFLAPSNLPDEMPHLLGKVRRGEPIEHYETVRVGKDGRLKDISLSISPLRDAQGNIIGASSIKRNITQRKVDERQLRMHSRLLSAMGQAVIVTDREGMITYWNDSAERLYGWPSSEVMGRSILKVTPTNTTQAQAVEIMAALVQGESWSGEFAVQKRDGSTFPAYVTDTPVIDEAGHLVSIIGLSLDMSESKRSEKALQESQRFLQSTLDALSSHIAVLDENGTIIAVNKVWRQFSQQNGGTPMSCGAGANYFEVCGNAMGPWAEEAAEVIQGIRAVMTGQHETFCLEYPCHSPTEKRWFNVRVTRFVGEGPLYVVVAHENVTARTLGEAALKRERDFSATVIDTIGNLVVVLNRQGHIVRFNRACEQLTGYAWEEVKGKTLHQLLLVPDEAEAVSAVFSDICAGHFPGTHENAWVAKDGSHQLIAWSNTALLDAEGAVEYIIGTGTDVTERRRAETEQVNLQVQMEQQRQRLKTIVASVPGLVWENWGHPDDTTERVNFVSDYIETMLGYSVAEWLSTPNFWLTIIHPTDKERVAQEAALIFAGGKAVALTIVG